MASDCCYKYHFVLSVIPRFALLSYDIMTKPISKIAWSSVHKKDMGHFQTNNHLVWDGCIRIWPHICRTKTMLVLWVSLPWKSWILLFISFASLSPLPNGEGYVFIYVCLFVCFLGFFVLFVCLFACCVCFITKIAPMSFQTSIPHRPWQVRCTLQCSWSGHQHVCIRYSQEDKMGNWINPRMEDVSNLVKVYLTSPIQVLKPHGFLKTLFASFK